MPDYCGAQVQAPGSAPLSSTSPSVFPSADCGVPSHSGSTLLPPRQGRSWGLHGLHRVASQGGLLAGNPRP